MKEAARKLAGIGDAAVEKATGKTWAQWLALLDAVGAKKMAHREITALLGAHIDARWWKQMVAVGYEQARGLRAVHQKVDGFSASASKTYQVPLKKLLAASKALRLAWAEGEARVEVKFLDKGGGKSQVTVQQGRLPSEREVQRSKAAWQSAFGELGEWLARQG
jgi:hypothetical protein